MEISQYAQIVGTVEGSSDFWKFHSDLRFLELSQEAQIFGNFTVISDFWKLSNPVHIRSTGFDNGRKLYWQFNF